MQIKERQRYLQISFAAGWSCHSRSHWCQWKFPLSVARQLGWPVCSAPDRYNALTPNPFTDRCLKTSLFLRTFKKGLMEAVCYLRKRSASQLLHPSSSSVIYWDNTNGKQARVKGSVIIKNKHESTEGSCFTFQTWNESEYADYSGFVDLTLTALDNPTPFERVDYFNFFQREELSSPPTPPECLISSQRKQKGGLFCCRLGLTWCFIRVAVMQTPENSWEFSMKHGYFPRFCDMSKPVSWSCVIYQKWSRY